MNGERELIARVEAADVARLAQLLRRPSRDEEETLRIYFGDERYRRLHSLALQYGQSRAPLRMGRVVVLHGVMGGELTRVPPGGGLVSLWFSLWRIVKGDFSALRLDSDGRTEPNDIRPTGILKRYYGELLLSLARRWDVRPFWYDWRKDIRLSASALESHLSAWFDEDATVHLVAHSMGGLVARAFMKNYPARWNRMRRAGSKLVMLGTPNFGSFSITQVLTGTEALIRLLAKLDLRHSPQDLRDIAASFPGCYQMLPSPEVMPTMRALYQREMWNSLAHVSQDHLQAAREFQEWLSDMIDPEQMIYIAGCNQPTCDDILNLDTFPRSDFNRASNTDLYHLTPDGDGTVPHRLGFLRDNKPIFGTVYYVEEEHGKLPANRQVIDAIDDLLDSPSHETSALLRVKPLLRTRPSEAELRERYRLMHEVDSQLDAVIERAATRAQSAESPEAANLSADERRAEQLVVRSFLHAGETSAISQVRIRPEGEIPVFEISLVHGSIDDPDIGSPGNRRNRKDPPVDAISVGHYIGVRPQNAEEALDIAISRALLRQHKGQAPARIPETDRIITSYTERGVLRGELGQPFFLTDPRPSRSRKPRLIAIAGMGLPGRFSTPELTVLVRELCWSLGQAGREHLLTVLIGAGAGNLTVRDAILAWMRGIQQAVIGASDMERRLRRITFVERDPRRLKPMRAAILEAAEALSDVLQIRYVGLDSTAIEKLMPMARELHLQEFKRQWDADPRRDRIPTRINVQLTGDTYCFGAITEDASIPERSVKLDPRLVMKTNDKLAGAIEPQEQLQLGRFLERLMIPEDLRPQLFTDAPLVMVLDAVTARIHWELLAQPEQGSFARPGAALPPGECRPEAFLATARGFTRQLRTNFAPPPDPPPPPRRVLRVLVVADPAADAPLPGAEREGSLVADLFESFNTTFAHRTPNRVEVHRLFGSYEATRENVLQKLMLEPWDVLHFAGHCYYNEQEPSASGWIFGLKDKEILSANELVRIDRVPKFIFSNACESGITPDRADKRNAAMAPSFAEAFFARGVTNFVCTAWPIDDAAACDFARRVYSGLLGMVGDYNDPDATPQPEPMYVAMQEARKEICRHGGRTWGAYQHYGNPNFRLFHSSSFTHSTRRTTARS